ncbi:isocitrate lyase/phosphoenolpyruvate mutase family protein [Undibacterium sp. TS12]|uniref:isocitrate lyase/PEP mutase family protein n=1 Tax=Undibacterium sp. TS12 TaxID=2908202 RepID=UPI001F4CDAAE|nr:isocitrate lyase/phosphoenolpyruvate mutase family protein [Undibacterium sp. TS12]MCH8622192.1 isocitrate lyase/phosphoenolpyruvate mutase family protein [Undibacterium sp. TS12]
MTATSFSIFKELHTGSTPLLLPNAWDAASAVLFERDGARAVATSSASLAWALGYADGGTVPRDELLAAVRRIMRVIRVPLSVDIEDGYSDDADTVAALAADLQQCGVAGINLEDGGGAPELLVAKIKAIRNRLAGAECFINARTDVYLRELASGDAAIQMAITRTQAYQAAGASAAFLPGLSDVATVSTISQALDISINIMAVPGMPDIKQLFAAGCRRFSLGPAPFQLAYHHGRQEVHQFLHQGQTAALFQHELSYPYMNAALSGEA